MVVVRCSPFYSLLHAPYSSQPSETDMDIDPPPPPPLTDTTQPASITASGQGAPHSQCSYWPSGQDAPHSHSSYRQGSPAPFPASQGMTLDFNTLLSPASTHILICSGCGWTHTWVLCTLAGGSSY